MPHNQKKKITKSNKIIKILKKQCKMLDTKNEKWDNFYEDNDRQL